MCRYQAASEACSVAARRAEYIARNASKLASGIEDTNSQVIREATELVDEWVKVREGLSFAEEILTLAAQHPAEFEALLSRVNTPARRFA